MASSCPYPSNSEDADDSDQEEEEEHKVIRFGFVAKRSKRRLPCSHIEFDRNIRQKTLIFSHTRPRKMENTVLNFVRENLASLDSWTFISNEDYERVRPSRTTQLLRIHFHALQDRAMLRENARSSREVAQVNAFEKEWRIRTNMAKITVVPFATKIPAPLLVDGDDVGFSSRGSLMGLSISTMGYTTHVSQRVARAKSALTRLYRFRALATGLKLHLIKALVIPILSYPPIPLHALSHTAISRLQRVQNSALRFAFGTSDFTTLASLHEAASLPALSVRLHEVAAKLWQ
ncbi:hypothetical protein E2C01_014940 [Portunus trituberculatus]|uniref:RNA-directed DNA polymerase from transposon BS n=1 Tax=Portunus trituberculatus TaxID=210409 RepID=A0A5B7DL90_PORTR|nr:hypothetical protein [Portunus trituberculatus]